MIYHWIFQVNLNTKTYAGILKNMHTIKFYKSAFILCNLKRFTTYLCKYFTIFILHIIWALFAIENFLIYSSRHKRSKLIISCICLSMLNLHKTKIKCIKFPVFAIISEILFFLFTCTYFILVSSRNSIFSYLIKYTFN